MRNPPRLALVAANDTPEFPFSTDGHMRSFLISDGVRFDLVNAGLGDA